MGKIIVALVDGIVVPLTSAIAFLASSGILLVAFAALWAAFGVALVRRRSSIDLAWARIRRLPPPIHGLAWLLFLPVLAGLWIWRTSWPLVARLTLIGGLAGWNLPVSVPRAA